MFKEVKSIVDRGVPMPKILVSDRAQMVMSYHKNLMLMRKSVSEENLWFDKIGYCSVYSDKYAKIGFQVSELFDDELLKEKVVRVAEQKKCIA